MAMTLSFIFRLKNLVKMQSGEVRFGRSYVVFADIDDDPAFVFFSLLVHRTGTSRSNLQIM